MSHSKDEKDQEGQDQEKKKKLKIDKKAISDLNEEEQQDINGGEGSRRLCSVAFCQQSYIVVYTGFSC